MQGVPSEIREVDSNISTTNLWAALQLCRTRRWDNCSVNLFPPLSSIAPNSRDILSQLERAIRRPCRTHIIADVSW